MTLSARLWADNSDLAAEALAHPFVRRLGDGSLAREIFAGYVAQDAFFLESFARAYALALARSTDTPTLLTLADLLGGVREELGLHSSYAARWGIDMAGVVPTSATLAYTEFLLATAATGGLAHGLRGDDPVHAALRLARRVAGRRMPRGRTRSGCRPTPTRISRHWPPGWNNCSTNKTRTVPPCTRPTGGRCAWNSISSTPRSQVE